MERYAVSWPDVDVIGEGFDTARFATLREGSNFEKYLEERCYG